MDKNRTNSKQQQTEVTRHSYWMMLAILSSTLLVVMFAETMLLPALPEIMKEFKISYSTSAWIFSAYLIVAAVMTPISGKLSDTYGKKKILVLLLIIYTVGILAGGFSNNIYFLIATRLIQGVSLSAIPVAFSIVRDVFPARKLAMAVGIFGSAYSAGSVVGLLAGATIIHNLGWHATFFTIAPAAALITILIARFIQKDERNQSIVALARNDGGGSNKFVGKADGGNRSIRKSRERIDLMGAITLSVTITSFLVGLTLLQSGPSSSTAVGSSTNLSQIVSLFAISIASLFMFVIIERRSKSPLVNLNLIKHRALFPSYVIMISVGITIFLVYPTIVQLVRSPVPIGFAGNAIEAANVQLPFMIVFLIFASTASFIISKFGSIKPALIGTIIAAIGAFSMLAAHSSELLISTNLAIIAAGLALVNTAGWNIIVSSSPKEHVGISVGIGSLLLFMGMSIGPALAGMYMQANEVHIVNGNFASPQSYNMIFLTAVLLSVISIIFAAILKRRLSVSEVETTNTS